MTIDEDDELLDVPAACRFIGGTGNPINPSTLWRGVKNGRYSPPIKVGANMVRWRKRELRADIERLNAGSDGDTALRDTLKRRPRRRRKIRPFEAEQHCTE
jgi:predicted DNA-binding transcriptional regulator AlpA